jgi:sRNA-binding carbon storage regulator CsrA
MLVLTRKEGEAILIYPADHISDAMTVKELFSHGPIRININKLVGTVRIGIDASLDLVVLRNELEKSTHIPIPA